jgi:uncharacterized protein YjlB
MTRLAPLSSLKISSHQIPAYKLTPNTSIQQKPLLIYHSAFPDSVTASAIEKHLKEIDVVTPQWRYTMYSTAHFHSTTHEVLVVSQGKAKLCFGGEQNDGRVEQEVGKGDVIVVPAGVGHRLLEDLSGADGFEMVGSYPKSKEWDMCYGKAGEEKKVEGISKLGWFQRDPVYGDEGPVLDT